MATSREKEQTTLSPRGLALAQGFDYRAFETPVITDIYHPVTNPTGHINLGQAEHYAMLPVLAERISALTHPTSQTNPANQTKQFPSPANLSYNEGCWGSRRLRLGLASHLNRYFKPITPVTAEEILVANGVMSICSMLATALFEPGEGILMPRPVYAAFESDFGTTAGVKCVFTPFNGVDQFSAKAVECYERALLKARKEGVEVRAMMLCNPHNPLGRCYPHDTIVAIMQFCEKHKLHLLSDEIYALSTYDNDSSAADLPAFASALSFDSSQSISPERLHVLYGLSKDFCASGLRIGMLHTRNAELSRAMSAMTQFHWIGGASEEVACRMLEDAEGTAEFFSRARASLAHLLGVARDLLADKGVPVLHADAGFFLWVDLRQFLGKMRGEDGEVLEGWEAEGELSKRFGAARVWPNSGSEMKAEEPGWFRVVVTYREEILRVGLGRMFEALGI